MRNKTQAAQCSVCDSTSLASFFFYFFIFSSAFCVFYYHNELFISACMWWCGTLFISSMHMCQSYLSVWPCTMSSGNEQLVHFEVATVKKPVFTVIVCVNKTWSYIYQEIVACQQNRQLCKDVLFSLSVFLSTYVFLFLLLMANIFHFSSECIVDENVDFCW